ASVGVSAGDPVTMVLLDGDGQTAVVNETCPQPLRVRVLDAYGNPVPGVSISWSLFSKPNSTSGGVLSSSLVQTDVDGVASVSFKLGRYVGTYVIRATRSGLAGSPAEFSLNAIHAPLHSIVVSPGSVSLRAGEVLHFGVVGMDVFGNVWSISPAWSVWGSIGVVNGTGFFVAEFVGSGFVNASFGGKTGSASVGVSAGDPITMVLLDGDGQIGVVNETCPQPLRVRVLDAYGNPVPGVHVGWSIVSKPRNNSGGAFSLSLVQTDAWGVASVSFRLGKHVGAYDVAATKAGIIPINFILEAQPGEPVAMVVMAPPRLNAAETSQLGVETYDAFGNRNTFYEDPAELSYTLHSPSAYMVDLLFSDTRAGESKIDIWVTDHPTAFASTSIVITPLSVATLTFSTPYFSIEAGGERQLQFQGKDAFGNLNTTWMPVWTVIGGIVTPSPSTPSQFATFKAGNSMGAGSINISAGNQIQDTLMVTILPGPIHFMEISPGQIACTLSETRPIRAYGYDRFGNPVQIQNSWSLSSDIGKIENGLF
ncbi:MAG: Ig-like domain-containing protein, partial [Candidatus Thermoplasmatota archaeon]|nr:Ig-like domain-containing protein [Candidatus Thermoplasmatota archaeon]